MNAPGKGGKTTSYGVPRPADMNEMKSGDFAQIPVRIKSSFPHMPWMNQAWLESYLYLKKSTRIDMLKSE